MNRQPIYHRNRSFRVISCANALWVAQREVQRDEGMRMYQPGWEDLGPRETQEDALNRMSSAAA